MIQKQHIEVYVVVLIAIGLFSLSFYMNGSDIRGVTGLSISEIRNQQKQGDSGGFSALTGLAVEEISGKEIENYIKEASQTYGTPENLIKAHITAESGFNPRAISPGCGAAGLIQLMPGTAKELGLKVFKDYDFITCNAGKTRELQDFMAGKSLSEFAAVDERFNPQKNIMAGEKYLKQQTDRFKGDIELGLAAYNAGAGAVLKRCCKDGSCVKFADCAQDLPLQTQKYVEKIIKLSGGEISLPSKYSYNIGEDVVTSDGKTYIVRTIGTYSVNPSFSVNIDYNIGEYDLIKQQMLGYGDNKGMLDLVADCERNEKNNGKTVEICVGESVKKINERQEMKDNALVLFNGPCDPKENLWSDAVEDIGDCIASVDDNCYCSITITQADQSDFDGEVRIKLEKQEGGSGFTISLDDDKNQLSYAIDGNIAKNINLDIKMRDIAQFAIKNNGVISFTTEEPKSGKCAVDKRKFKFCVKSEKKMLYYDETAKKAENRNIEYKFAIEFPDTTPPAPVKGAIIKDRQKAEESFIVKWNRNKEPDVGKYVIYFAKSEYNVFDPNLELSAIKQRTELNVFEASLADAIDSSSDINIDDASQVALLEPGKPYHVKTSSDEYYVLALEKKSYDPYVSIIEDGVEYDFAITAVDVFGNEINNKDANQKITPIMKQKSIDDLAPQQLEITSISAIDDSNIKIEFPMPTTNEDGSQLVDLQAIRVYYNGALMSEYKATELNCQYLCTITAENKGPGNYGISAVDEAGNEMEVIESAYGE